MRGLDRNAQATGGGQRLDLLARPPT